MLNCWLITRIVLKTFQNQLREMFGNFRPIRIRTFFWKNIRYILFVLLTICCCCSCRFCCFCYCCCYCCCCYCPCGKGKEPCKLIVTRFIYVIHFLKTVNSMISAIWISFCRIRMWIRWNLGPIKIVFHSTKLNTFCYVLWFPLNNNNNRCGNSSDQSNTNDSSNSSNQFFSSTNCNSKMNVIIFFKMK